MSGKSWLRRFSERSAASAIRRVSLLLSERQVHAAGAALGGVARRVLRRRRQLVASNMHRILGDEEAERVERLCWSHYGRLLLSAPRTFGMTLEDAMRRSEIRGTEHLERVKLREGGVVIATAHFGAWELAAPLLPLVRDEVLIVARGFDNEMMGAALSGARGGIRTVDRRRAARPIIETLERGGAVVMLVDQAVIPRQGIRVPFLGEPAWTPTAPARLALHHDVPVLPLFCVPGAAAGRGDRLVVVEIEPPIDPRELTGSDRSVEAITARLNDLISARIRRQPELWFWMHDRWKG